MEIYQDHGIGGIFCGFYDFEHRKILKFHNEAYLEKNLFTVFENILTITLKNGEVYKSNLFTNYYFIKYFINLNDIIKIKCVRPYKYINSYDIIDYSFNNGNLHSYENYPSIIIKDKWKTLLKEYYHINGKEIEKDHPELIRYYRNEKLSIL